MLYPYNDRIPSMGTNVVIIYKYLKKKTSRAVPYHTGSFLVFKRLAHKYPANAKLIGKTAVLH